MAFEIILSGEAEKDIDESFIWYESQQQGLGENFIDALSQSFLFIADNPHASQKIRKGVSRYVMNKFPFGIYYSIREQQILVIAILHFKRKSSTWRRRKK